MKEATRYISKGWPRTSNGIQNQETAKLHALRNDLIQGWVFYDDRIVIPQHYRPAILEELHEGHPGVVRMKMLARQKVYWPSLNADIEKFCNNAKCAP